MGKKNDFRRHPHNLELQERKSTYAILLHTAPSTRRIALVSHFYLITVLLRDRQPLLDISMRPSIDSKSRNLVQYGLKAKTAKTPEVRV